MLESGGVLFEGSVSYIEFDENKWSISISVPGGGIEVPLTLEDILHLPVLTETIIREIEHPRGQIVTLPCGDDNRPQVLVLFGTINGRETYLGAYRSDGFPFALTVRWMSG